MCFFEKQSVRRRKKMEKFTNQTQMLMSTACLQVGTKRYLYLLSIYEFWW